RPAMSQHSGHRLETGFEIAMRPGFLGQEKIADDTNRNIIPGITPFEVEEQARVPRRGFRAPHRIKATSRSLAQGCGWRAPASTTDMALICCFSLFCRWAEGGLAKQRPRLR